MATDVPKQRFLVKDLLTSSVTLYPARARVVRNIPDVFLQPGPNEIEIYGLTPTADEHSVQIEGQGTAATISDMTVDLVPNTDIFEEVYPPDSEDESSESEEEEDSEDEIDAVKAISEELKELRATSMHAVELQRTANQRLQVLDTYVNTVKASDNSPEDVTKILKQYQTERMETFTAHSKATEELDDLNKRIARKEKEKWKAGKDERKHKEKLEKEKERERVKKERQKAERRKEAQRLKDERIKFWPKKVYRVILHLETPLDTPASSRRGSIDSVTLAKGKSPALPEEHGDNSPSEYKLSLSLSYVTSEASWRPRYDLSISSLHKTAKISYRAEFTNGTSETWKDAKISLSTSQTSYTGLEDTVPFMEAWHIRLGKDSGRGSLGDVMSYQELHKPRVGNSAPSYVNRSELFGLERAHIPGAAKKHVKCGKCGGPHPGASCPFYVSSKFMDIIPAQMSVPFGNQGAPSASYGPIPQQAQHPMMAAQAFQPASGASARFRPRRKERERGSQPLADEEDPEEYAEGGASEKPAEYDPTIEDRHALTYEESTWEEEGLTASYDVPGFRTLPPSSLTRRHKIASLTASNIHLSYISIPKLRCAAFLRAKVRNPSSSITLLKGSAGVTLDESFLGNMTLPRVSPGQVFELPLGVDPAIHVSYPKPNVRRSTQGFINKESAQVFTRAIWLTNTRSAPVELLVLDQVPVSQDERLKVALLQPRGLEKVGDAVKAGASAKENAEGKNGKWGKAVATLKKNGEVAWNVTLEKGQACLLGLEYEARLPSTERIVAS